MKKWIIPERFLTEFVSNSPEETFALGKRIAPLLSAGAVVALRGELGSGKTRLVKGIACGLGIAETVTSPTYTIISEYRGSEERGSPALYHIDAYRLESAEDFDGIGGREIINSNGISVIEWSERIEKSLPPDAIKITLSITGPSSRAIKIDSIESVLTEGL